MNLSTKGRYGLRALFQLALMDSSKPVPLNVIAQKQGLSEPYLEQLIAPLRKAGLVESIRGVRGGYKLARKPEEITVGEILRVLEGPIAPAKCATEAGAVAEYCELEADCVVREVWIQIRDSIAQVVDNITLADMVERQRLLKQARSPRYYI